MARGGRPSRRPTFAAIRTAAALSWAGLPRADAAPCSLVLPPASDPPCPPGTYRSRLQVPGTLSAAGTGNGSGGAAGPFLSVHGAASPLINGIYSHNVDPACLTHQHYVKGDYRLLWEPGPRVVYGLRWLIFDAAHPREDPYYYKYTPDGTLGWRGTRSVGMWSVGAGAAPAPLVASERPDSVLYVSGAGESAVNGAYVRTGGAIYPTGYTAYEKAGFTLLWEPAPQVTRGLRWVIFSTSQGSVSQATPYYARLSADGNAGYEGTWEAGRGAYPPPRVSAVQTAGCFRCPAGTYSGANWTECSRCPPGRYSLGGADACTACLNGTFANSDVLTESVRRLPSCGQPYLAASRASCTVAKAGATGCQTCTAGRFSGVEAGSCGLCAPGSYSEVGANACQACPAGYWSGLEQPSCSPCPAGRFGVNASAVSVNNCLLCGLGSYGGGPGRTVCSLCASGSYAATYRMTACSPCPPGSYSAVQGADRCTLCPNRTGMPGQTAC
mmetsp:Transcript_113969/g.354908  ORF Transcript_113969/g.354908 Transcript_113969/m.354908 type:complete len:498 (-) Transcript_113969:11-1504(-)